MELDFSKTVVQSAAADTKKEWKSVQQYDIAADRQQLKVQLVNSKEVDALVSTIEVYHLETIVSFGAEAAKEVSKTPDAVLNSMNLLQFDDSSEILSILAKIMAKFDIDEIKDIPKRWKGLFGKRRNSLDDILEKYHIMGEEVDKIYVRLKQYEAEIQQANHKLNQVLEENINHYHKLVCYSLAGEQGRRELEDYIVQRRKDMEESKDSSIQFEILRLEQAKSLLEQRIQDLQMTEMMAIQTIPMIQTVAFQNRNLVQKINTAFLIALPVFRQALAQVILLKRQKIQAEAISALDAKVNKMLIEHIAEKSKQTETSAFGSSVKIKTLETAWKTIINGIEETKQMQEDVREKKTEDQARLEKIKLEFVQFYYNSAKK